jgi:hypothetical protein
VTGPRVSIRRLVQTSNGPLLLELNNLFGLSISAATFDADGWEQKSRAHGWSERGDYNEKFGRESLAVAVREAAGIPPEEADAIATDILLTWESQISDEEIAQSHKGLRFGILLLAGAAVFAIGFFALLIVLVVVLVF